MCNDEHGVQSRGDIANGDQILLNKGRPEENICRSEEQVSAQTNGMPEVRIGPGSTAKQENADENGKAVRFEAADRMRRALSRGKRPHAEKVADGFGAHCDATGKDQKHCIESQRPRSQLLVRSHRISLGIVCKIMDGAFHRC